MLPALKEERLEKLRELLSDGLKSKLSEDPELERVLAKLEEIAQGAPVVATRCWEEPTSNGPSLASVQEQTPTGGCTSRRIDRWRKSFTTKRAQKIMAQPDGAAHATQHYNLKQEQIGPERAISFRDSLRSKEEMREALAAHLTTTIEIEEVRPVQRSDPRQGELFVNLFPQYKASDLEHREPRWCLNMKLANEPVKDASTRRKYPPGTHKLRPLLRAQDWTVNVDAVKGYKQRKQSEQTGRRQRHWVPTSEWNQACERAGRRDLRANPRHRTKWLAGEWHIALQPLTVQFGGTLSREQFEGALTLVITELRQTAGLRIVNQVDDMALSSAHGVTAIYTDMLVLFAVFHYYGWKLHLYGEKADQIWPRKTFIFDGTEWHPHTNQIYSPEKRDQRHREQLKRFLRGHIGGATYTLQQGYAIVNSQGSHRETHYPTAWLLCEAMQHLSRETARITQGNTDPTLWQRIMRRFPDQAIAALWWLSEPREVGNYMRSPEVPRIAVKSDSSPWGMGYQIRDDSGVSVRGGLLFQERAAKLAHTVQEQEGNGLAVSLSLKLSSVAGTTTKPAVLELGNDNTAALKQWIKPGAKPQMVKPAFGPMVQARQRNIVVKPQYLTKHFFDVVTRVDYDSRPPVTAADLQLNPEQVKKALSELGVAGPIIDGAASRVNAMPFAKAYISRYPEPEALPQPDVLTYNLRTHPDLQGATVVINPPAILIPRVLNKVRDEEATVVLIAPHWHKTPEWFPTMSEMTRAWVQIPKPEWRNPTERPVQGETPNYPLITVLLCGKECTRAGCPQPQLSRCLNRTQMKPVGAAYYRGEH